MTDERRFQSLASRADAMRRLGGDESDYWAGYGRGLRRAYYGAQFGTDEEHARWIALSERQDVTSKALGRGYADGLVALDRESVPDWRPPSPERIREVIKTHNLTGSQAARLMYLADSRQVRKYTGGERQMDRARWFALWAHLLLPPETLAEIERAMAD